MNSITMAADSTQSEIKDNLKGKNHKKNTSKKRKKSKVARSRRTDNESNSDCDSDMDLTKELKPIGGYLQDRELTVEHMFRSISGKKLKAMLPEILKPIPVNELKRLCIEQLECMSKKRISRILEGADPETISSTGTEEDSSLSDDDKHQDGSTDQERHSDNAASDHKEDESHIPVATTQPDIARSPDSCVSRTSSRSRSSSSSRSELPGYESNNSGDTSPQPSKHAETADSESPTYTEQFEAESSTEEIVEEVVYEEVVLEDGDDLESILGHGSFLKGTKDARLKTVASHKDDPTDRDNDVMVIEREEREEQSQVTSIKDGDEDDGGTLDESADVKEIQEGSSAEQIENNTDAGTMAHVTSTLTDSDKCKDDINKDIISSPVETMAENDNISSPTPVSCVAGSSTADTEGHRCRGSVSDDNMEEVELSTRLELEEGEIEDSSSECEDDQVEEEVDMESRNDSALENVKNVGSPEVMAPSVKAKGSGKKKKVRVIKRIIKVIRKKPKLEGQSNPTASRDLAKKLKMSHQAKCRHDLEIPDNYMNVKIEAEPGLEQSKSSGASSRSCNQSKSGSRLSGNARVKPEPSAAAAIGQSDLTSVSEKSLNQMEILELEMRARAIKAMLKKQEEKEKRLESDSKKRIKLKRKMTES